MSVDPNSIGIPLAARPEGDPRKIDGVKGGDNFHGMMPKGKSIYDIAVKEAGGKPAKKSSEPTVGTQVFDNAKSAMDFVKKFDPQNMAGTVPHALDMMKQLQGSMGVGQIMTGIVGMKLGGLMKMLPILQQLGNIDLLSQAQGLIGQEFAKLPIPSIPQIPNVEQITNDLQKLKEIPSKITEIV